MGTGCPVSPCVVEVLVACPPHSIVTLNNLYLVPIFCTSTDFQLYKGENLAMKETVTCWTQKETHNRLKVFCALHRLSMMQVITQAVKEWLEQHGSNLGDEALQVLQRGKPHEV
jgi:hypothetical protein